MDIPQGSRGSNQQKRHEVETFSVFTFSFMRLVLVIIRGNARFRSLNFFTLLLDASNDKRPRITSCRHGKFGSNLLTFQNMKVQ